MLKDSYTFVLFENLKQVSNTLNELKSARLSAFFMFLGLGVLEIPVVAGTHWRQVGSKQKALRGSAVP